MVTTNDNAGAVAQRLDSLAYDLRDFDLLRFQECDVDAVMREIVSTMKVMSAPLRAEVFTRSLEAQDLFETYGERSTSRKVRRQIAAFSFLYI